MSLVPSLEMNRHGFEIFVAPHETMCAACAEDRLDDLRAAPHRYLRFPGGFSPSHVIQLGAAVTSLTGVSEDFGNERNRSEPRDMLFVDRLTTDWVRAAAKLSLSRSTEIEELWIRSCAEEEGDIPSWASEPREVLIEEFLRLCTVATSASTDLVMVWRL